jgi:predicted PhzF superfamily epimerase YddE/YHI9
VGRSKFDYLVELESEAVLRKLDPDMGAIARVEARGVIVTSRGDGKGKYDFVSRFFAPQSGVPEDPVTGSAHCALAPYWGAKLGKKELVAYQSSPRGGELRLRLVGDRVKIGGQAVTVLRGELTAGNMAP